MSWRYLAEGHDGSLTSNPFDDTETIAAHCESCWKGPDGVEAILRRERRGFVSWRYLAEGHDGSLTSNPFDDTETIAAHCESCSPW